MTRETAAINAGRSVNGAVGRPFLPEGPYWDLELLTPDDVCALLKVKKAGSTTPWRTVHSRPSG